MNLGDGGYQADTPGGTLALVDLWPFSLCNSGRLENLARVCGWEWCAGLRGVPKADFARLDYYDVWFPNLSPGAGLVQEGQGAADQRAWTAFRRKFRREMSAPDRSRELDVLAALQHHVNLSLWCYRGTRAAATGPCRGNC